MKYPVFIEPGNDDGMLLDSRAVKGTYVVVKTLSERNSLITEHSGSIVVGSLCFVSDENKTYRYNGSDWVQAKDETDISSLTARVETNETNITNLTTRVTTSETDISNLTPRVAKNETDISTINDHINKNVVTSLEIKKNADTVNLETTAINILNDNIAKDVDALPLASDENAGLMTLEDYTTLYDLQSRVESLEGTTDRLLYLTEDTLKEVILGETTYSPAFYINGELYQVTSDTEITQIPQSNLRGFIAIFKDNLTLGSYSYNINFTSGGSAYSLITVTNTTIKYDENIVYNGRWVDTKYRTMMLIDGEDIANSHLISFLQTNTVLNSTFSISDLKCTIRNIQYTFSGLIVGSKITREVNASNINSFVTTIYDKKGQQLYVNPFRGIAVVINGTYHIWHYYPNEESGSVIGWKDDGVDTVKQFTNTSLGIIKGSNSEGQIYAESNGTGSVNGWTNLTNRVTNVENNKADDVLASATTKGLMAASDFSKLQNIESNAQVNIFDGIQVDGTDLELVDKKVNIKQGNNMLFQVSNNELTINANIPDPITIDDNLNTTSINPVQNKVITERINTLDTQKADLSVVQLKITDDNKLSSDLVDDTGYTHKFVTQSEKNQIVTNTNNISSLQNNKQDKMSAGTNITISNNKISTTANRVNANLSQTTSNNLTNIKIEDTLYNIPVYGLTIFTMGYKINATLINIIASPYNPTGIESGGTATLIFTPKTGYSLPETITITKGVVNYTWNNGVLALDTPTDDISLTIEGVSS